ncbi:5-formyltetrahydrofolate cyclo-ligase [Saccharothrix xinjiangensis]|uniref:5-formyltetrahydrofolate cyclo-ligase n=1 Tax=Saccharothrix xinjiangensis TaxID=204798 RepID=A0ABV9XX73_9PSEU
MTTSGERDQKLTLRTRLRALRRSGPVPDMSAEVLLAVGAFGVSAGETVCAYLASRFEPGSLAMVEALRSRGCRVLLPVVVGQALDWAAYEGGLRTGAFGLREPVGPLLGPAAVGTAALVLAPALAVDHAGVRLGKGGGYYDRALRLSTGPVVGVVRDEEFVPSLPAEPHDVPVDAVLTPSLGLVRLPL